MTLDQLGDAFIMGTGMIGFILYIFRREIESLVRFARAWWRENDDHAKARYLEWEARRLRGSADRAAEMGHWCSARDYRLRAQEHERLARHLLERTP